MCNENGVRLNRAGLSVAGTWIAMTFALDLIIGFAWFSSKCFSGWREEYGAVWLCYDFECMDFLDYQ